MEKTSCIINTRISANRLVAPESDSQIESVRTQSQTEIYRAENFFKNKNVSNIKYHSLAFPPRKDSFPTADRLT